MGQPHKHAEVIKAWADGEDIQYSLDGKVWTDLPNPMFANPDAQYRAKPKNIVVKRYVNYQVGSGMTRTLNYDDSECNIEYVFDPEGILLSAKVIK